MQAVENLWSPQVRDNIINNPDLSLEDKLTILRKASAIYINRLILMLNDLYERGE